MVYFKKGNNLFALLSEPKKFIEVEEDGRKVKKAVVDDSYVSITEKQYHKLIKARFKAKTTKKK